MMNTTLLRRSALSLFTLAFTASLAHAQPPAGRLLARAQGRSAEAPGASVAETRRAAARVNPKALASERIQLALFDDVQVTARRTARSHPRAGSTIWQGRLEDPHNGEVTLALVDGALAGSVTVDGRLFEIGLVDRDLHAVQELNSALFPTEDPPLLPDLVSASSSETTTSTTIATVDGPALIDVMVVWTPAARTALGGPAGVQSRVDLAVANANAAYANSGIATSLRLVHSGEISYTESPSAITTDLSRLAGTSDGHMDAVHNLRNQYGADIVTLLGHGYASSGYCGIGYLMSTVSTSFASKAFNVVDQSCAAGYLSYAHEVGHNQGLHHDPANAGGTPAYSYAYGFQDPGAFFRTVMSYGGAVRVQHISNPNVFYSGRPTGTFSQDNARALNGTAATVASFRSSASTATCAYSVSPTSLSFPATGGTATVQVSTSDGCGWTTVSGASWMTVGPGASGAGSVLVSVAPNVGVERSASLTIAGMTVTVSEAATTSTCAHSVSPAALSFPAEGGSADVVVTTQTGCSWSSSSGVNWLSVSGAGTGSGKATITSGISAGTERAATITVAGQPVTVSQSAYSPPACTFEVWPTSLTVPSTGGVFEVQVTTANGCDWTARSHSGWVKVSGGGPGTGIVTLKVSGTSGGGRTALATIAGHTVSLSQLAAPKLKDR